MKLETRRWWGDGNASICCPICGFWVSVRGWRVETHRTGLLRGPLCTGSNYTVPREAKPLRVWGEETGEHCSASGSQGDLEGDYYYTSAETEQAEEAS